MGKVLIKCISKHRMQKYFYDRSLDSVSYGE